MYSELLLKQMEDLKRQEATLKNQIKALAKGLDRVWSMQEDILELVKNNLDKEESNGQL